MTWHNFIKSFLARLTPVSIPAEHHDAYRDFLLHRQREITIPALAVGTIVMVGMLGIDLVIIPDVIWISIFFRIFVVLPVSLLAFAYLRQPGRTLRAHRFVASSVALTFGTLACIIVVSSSAPLAQTYLTANNITIMFVILILGLPTRLAAYLASALIVIQAVILWFSPFASLPLVFLITSISFAISLSALYGSLERAQYQRTTFLANLRDQRQLQALASQNALLERLSALDPLTGLSNRRSFDAILERAIQEARADPTIPAVALTMIDVDHFKLYNDTCGHSAGDTVLKSVSSALAQASADTDPVARFGGEEFAVISSNVEPAALEMKVARLRASIERLRIPHPGNPAAPFLTVSIGVVYADRSVLDGLTRLDLIDGADAALYTAKAEGRNRGLVRPLESARDPEPGDLRSHRGRQKSA